MQQVAIRAATAIMMNTISTTGTTHTYTGIDTPAETQSGMYAYVDMVSQQHVEM